MESTEVRAPSHEGNITSLVRKNCSQLFILYTGLWREVSYTGPDLLLQCGLGDRNLTVMRDPFNAFYEKGVSSEINSREMLTKWHYDYLTSMPHVQSVYGLGISMGGYAAILYGSLLGFDRVFAFSPSNLLRLRALKDVVIRAEGRTPIDVFYDPAHGRDKFFAESLADLPGVTLVPKSDTLGDGHYVMFSMMASGELPEIFPPFEAADEKV